MPKLHKLTYQNWDGHDRMLDFLGNQPPQEGVHTTLLTGHNGSHKSTILRELVAALALPERRNSLTFAPSPTHPLDSVPVICASGSVADRFPSKDNGGRRTEFDVPGYVYIGQRVGTNLLSKKMPLETAVAFALDANVRERFAWPFYARAHQLAGIIPRIDLEFRRKATSKRDPNPSASLLEFVQARAQGRELSKNNGRSLSQAMAQYLTEQFTYDDFTELEFALGSKRRGRIQVVLSDQDIVTISGLSLDAIRLGLLADELTLSDAQVVSRRLSKKYSVYELSSGEYHMLTTILALGFSLREGAVVLIDEPENSLHPQWQQEFMATLIEMCGFMKDGHLVISTHSPLIVSAAAPGSTVVDLSNAAEFVPASPISFGASADDILFEQFGIASSRNRNVVDIVQQAVELAERGVFKGPEFNIVAEQLQELRGLLRPSDPLSDVLDALLEGED